MRKLLLIIVAFSCCTAMAQNKMTPELLWKLGRVSGLGISKDGRYILYSVSTPNADENKSSKKTYMIPVAGGDATIVTNADSLLNNEKISADGKYMISNAAIKVKNVTGADTYPELKKSNVYIFDNLDYRHWDTYEDGKFDHVMLFPMVNGKAGEG